MKLPKQSSGVHRPVRPDVSGLAGSGISASFVSELTRVFPETSVLL